MLHSLEAPTVEYHSFHNVDRISENKDERTLNISSVIFKVMMITEF